MSATLLIGIDCATKANKTGLAFGCLDGNKLAVCSAERGKSEEWESGVDGKVEEWIAEGKRQARKVLLALDAPLGWPESLGESLCRHNAGGVLSAPAEQMFKRETDLEVYKATGQKPLEVGANLIARTAHSALSFLERFQIPLAWEPGYANMACVSAIEVYPAAMLKERGFPFEGYKKAQQAQSVRAKIIKRLESEMKLPKNIKDAMRENDDVLDAVVCVLAAADFVRGEAAPPENMKRAKKEGWIWVKMVDE